MVFARRTDSRFDSRNPSSVPGASIRPASSERGALASESRHPCSCGSAAGGIPSSVMPLSPS